MWDEYALPERSTGGHHQALGISSCFMFHLRRSLRTTVILAASVVLLSTACDRRGSSVPASLEIEAKSKAFIEKAMAEDRARVEYAREDETRSIRQSIERRAARDKARKDGEARAAAESARLAEKKRRLNTEEEARKQARAAKEAKLEADRLAAIQKVQELDEWHTQFAEPAKSEFEKFILAPVKERKANSVIGAVDVEQRNGSIKSYQIELHAPRFEIWPVDLDAERARLSAADKLNQKLSSVEWKGVAFVDAPAYRVLKQSVEEPRNTVKLFPSKRAPYEDGTWQDAHAYQKPILPLVGAYWIEKTSEGWKIEEAEGLTKQRFLDDWNGVRKRLAIPGAPELPMPKPRLIAEATLSLEAVDSPPAAAEPKTADEAKTEFEKYVIQRTPDTLTLQTEERATKPSTNGVESPFYTKKTTNEFHSPSVTVEPLPLNAADHLNELQWRGRILLKADAFRIVSISPEPEKRVQGEDGTWQSSYGTEEFIATKKGGEWTVVPKLAHNNLRLLKK